MIEKISLDMLTPNNVSCKREYFQENNGVIEPLGLPFRKSYINNVDGIEEVKTELDVKYANIIFSVWGVSKIIVK